MLTGSQSFALASMAGAGAYVGLTELSVRLGASYGKGLPLGARITAGVCTTIAVRALAWRRKPDDLLPPMANYAAARTRAEARQGAPEVRVDAAPAAANSGPTVTKC